MDKSESIKELSIALCKAQAAMGCAKKGKDNPFFKSKYADLGEVVKAVKEPFAENGLSYTQFPIEDGGRIGVETMLLHESGEYLCSKFTVALNKQDAQAAGSAITYCRRYALQAMAGIPSADDDGNSATQANSAPAKPDVSKGVKALSDACEAGDAAKAMEIWSYAKQTGTSGAIYQQLSQANKAKIDSMDSEK